MKAVVMYKHGSADELVIEDVPIDRSMATDKEFRAAMQLFYDNKISAVIDKVYTMEEIREAHKRMESGLHMGKIVIKVSD